MNSLDYLESKRIRQKSTKKKTLPIPPCLGRELILLKRGLYPFAIVITPSLNREGWGGSPLFLTLHHKILIYRLLLAVVNILKWCEMLLEYVGMLKKNGKIFGG